MPSVPRENVPEQRKMPKGTPLHIFRHSNSSSIPPPPHSSGSVLNPSSLSMMMMVLVVDYCPCPGPSPCALPLSNRSLPLPFPPLSDPSAFSAQNALLFLLVPSASSSSSSFHFLSVDLINGKPRLNQASPLRSRVLGTSVNNGSEWGSIRSKS